MGCGTIDGLLLRWKELGLGLGLLGCFGLEYQKQ